MTTFVPTGITGRPIDHAIGNPEWPCDPTAPEINSTRREDDMQSNPNGRVAHRGRVLFLDQCLEILSRQVAMIPFDRGQTRRDGPLGVGSCQGVIAWLMRGICKVWRSAHWSSDG